jgi:ribosomal protein S18 acetylase RimI-like enzyme
MTIAVREARPDDLIRLATAVVAQPLLVRYGATAAGLDRDLTAALGRGEGLLVAEEQGEVVGFAWYQLRAGLGIGAYLKLIATVPGAESRGLGAALLDEVERRVALEQRHLLLLVSDFNADAQRFYERRGYARVGALPRAVLPDVDELVYSKRLR